MCSGSPLAANFTVVGTVGQIALVTVPGTVSLTSAGNTMSSTLVSSAATMTLAASNTLTVGGTLSVGANQVEGVYSGQFTVNVDYQ